ncbi:MAG TPA: M13 family metallopeptidase [Polyangia bacterium]|nr:M13 family metallopeptidase [Polyangia bacterium]
MTARRAIAVGVVCLGACNGLETPPEQPGVEAAAIDWSANPCTDFYQFACGNWQRWNPIPPDVSSYSRHARTQRDQVIFEYGTVVDDAQGKSHPNDPDAAKIGRYYKTCREALEASFIATPRDLVTDLARIAAIATKADVARVAGELLARGTPTLVGIGIGPDRDMPTMNTIYVDGASLAMDSPYYLDDDEASYRAAYVTHIDALAAAMRGVGANLPTSLDSATVLNVETALARGWPSPDTRRDAGQLHHPTAGADLVTATPSFDWVSFFTAANLGDVTQRRFDVAWPAGLQRLDVVLSSSSLDDLKAYLAWRVLEADAVAIGAGVRPLEFAFHTKLFGGAQEDVDPYWRCFLYARDVLGFALSKSYVAAMFGDDGVASASAILTAIRGQMQITLDGEAWLDAPTRAEAQKKLSLVAAKVGFPDSWTPYEGWNVVDDDYLGTILSRRTWEWSQSLGDLEAPVDRTRWGDPPITVNAWYDPTFNDITFPAAILSPPFFDTARPAAANYGAIGSVMGHELTHGFDDEGRQYDGLGALRDWWSPAVASAFDARAACVSKQFSGYMPVPGTNVDGVQTLGETIADLGGLKLALAAFHANVDDGGGGEASPGFFTPDQQFFVAYAQGWCENDRPEWLRAELTTDPHPPWNERINGAVRNVPGFADAFKCPAGAPLAPVDRCDVW